MIRIDPITRMDEIKDVMSKGDMWYRFVEGDSEFDAECIEATNEEEWYGVTLNDKLVGCLKVDLIHEQALMLHPYILPEFRFIARHLPQVVYTFLTWFRPEIEDLYSSVPDCFPEVGRYQDFCGFRAIGYVSDGYYKNSDYRGLIFYINRNWKIEV